MKAPARICIVRHGETDWNAAGVLQGWLDVPINDVGRQQARQLATDMADTGFRRIYSSPLCRALETAEILAGQWQLPAPTCHAGLKERNFGEIQGIPKSELAELNPVLYQQLLKRNPACSFEEGESMDDFATRVLDAVMDIGAAEAGAQVLVITHGWVMDVITRHIRHLPRHAILPMKRKNMEHLWLEASRNSIREGAA
jgi:probable phosphoglycerate mutase